MSVSFSSPACTWTLRMYMYIYYTTTTLLLEGGSGDIIGGGRPCP